MASSVVTRLDTPSLVIFTDVNNSLSIISRRPFGRQNRRTAADIGIQHDVVALGAIKYGVRNQRDWLHRRMRFQLFLRAATREAVGPRKIPDVGTIPAEAAELNVVGMRVFSALEHEHELVAGPVERPHATIGFGPNAEIQEVQT